MLKKKKINGHSSVTKLVNKKKLLWKIFKENCQKCPLTPRFTVPLYSLSPVWNIKWVLKIVLLKKSLYTGCINMVSPQCVFSDVL